MKSAGERGPSFEEDGGICPWMKTSHCCNERLVCVGDQMTHGGQKGTALNPEKLEVLADFLARGQTVVCSDK